MGHKGVADLLDERSRSKMVAVAGFGEAVVSEKSLKLLL